MLAAIERAETFTLTIAPQLHALQVMGADGNHNEDRIWRERVNDLASIFADALMLNGVMASSPDQYEHSSVQGDTRIDTLAMIQPHRCGLPGVVKYCLCPAIWLRGADNGKRITVCKADVIPTDADFSQS